MLLLTTLTTLSFALGAAAPAASLAEAASASSGATPATLPVADFPYLSEVHAGEHGSRFDPHQEALAALPDLPDITDDEADSGFGPAADAERLDAMRGGDDTSTSSIVMTGNVADNRATNVITGANMITDGAFANASGVPMVVQNTGANVLIQNATVINLQLR